MTQSQRSLLSVGGYPFTGKAVIEARRKHGEHWTTKMRYLHDRQTTCGDLLELIPACPDVHGVYLDTPGEGVVKHVHSFRHAYQCCHEFHNFGSFHNKGFWDWQ